jgi:hypothetical protein
MFKVLLDHQYHRGGHKESIKFRDTMNVIISCAIEMDKFIGGKYKDLQKQIKKTRQEYDRKYDALCSDKRNQIDDYFYDDEREEIELIDSEIEAYRINQNVLIEENLQLLFQSLFIAIYSRFEIYLSNLCNALRESESLQLKPKSLHGKGIQRSQEYLKKVACLNFPDNTKEWQVINLLSDIRNKLVHDPEHEFRREEVKPKLLDYFWLDDPYWEYPPWDDFDVPSIDIMFSLSSLRIIVDTFDRFSKDIDEAWWEMQDIKPGL